MMHAAAASGYQHFQNYIGNLAEAPTKMVMYAMSMCSEENRAERKKDEAADNGDKDAVEALCC